MVLTGARNLGKIQVRVQFSVVARRDLGETPRWKVMPTGDRLAPPHAN